MKPQISRRSFLKVGALALGSLALTRLAGEAPIVIPFPLPQDDTDYPSGEVGRIASKGSISVYAEPNDKSPIIRQIYPDELVNLYYTVTPSSGPSWNPVWYRVWGGYVHSARIQKVKFRFNQAANQVSEHGQLCEVTVPYTQAFLLDRYGIAGWQAYYRLYYLSTHWAIGVEEGPDRLAWYRLKDELTDEEYLVPAYHIRLIPDEEMAPISPDIPEEHKRIKISLQEQTLTAYEYDQVVFQANISSGIPSHITTNGIPSATPTGRYYIQSKMPSKHMGDDILTADADGYNLPGVPWTCFFLSPPGYAIHGAYWHDNFGIQMSHGCVNMRIEEAKWIFRWTDDKFEVPVKDHKTGWERRGRGTQLDIE
jgi:hypothetical protein